MLPLLSLPLILIDLLGSERRLPGFLQHLADLHVRLCAGNLVELRVCAVAGCPAPSLASSHGVLRIAHRHL